MNILIIGSKGFIGSKLLTYFNEQKNFLVWGADVVVDYLTPERYFLIDASNSDFKNIFEQQKFDVCINCSGAASVPDSLLNPQRDYLLNTANVFKLLDAIRIYQPNCKFLNLSSAAVYGNPIELPIKENSPVSPVSPYGIHKLMSEQICGEFYRYFKIPTCSLRIFSAYGEGLEKQLFWDLFVKSKLGNKIILYGTGRESRDFIYIEDLLQAIYLVALKGEFNGGAINIANGEEIFISDCVYTFYNLFGRKIEYEFSGQVRSGDPNNWVANIDQLVKLGYKKQFSLKEGLSGYYKWLCKRE